MTKLLYILLLSGAFAFAQTSVSHPEFDIDCAVYQTACNSYKQMVNSNDKDVLKALSNKHAFVCMRPDVDIFFIITFPDPKPDNYHKVKNGLAAQTGAVVFYRFKDGLSDDFQYAVGDWTRLELPGETIESFAQAPYAKAQSSISDSEISFSYSYPNLGGTMTFYQVQIRRSLRFVETLQWKNPVKDKAGKITRTDNERDDKEGTCHEFNQKVVR